MMRVIDKETAKSALAERPQNADKTTVGTLLSVCGSYGMAGAAIMSSKAALRSGIGLLKLLVPDRLYPILAPALPEAVFMPYDNINAFEISQKEKYCGAVLCGCGLGVTDSARELVWALMQATRIPMILDADALNIIAANPGLLKSAKAPVIVTPHEREFSRLAKRDLLYVRENREPLAAEFAAEYGAVVVLKGHETIIASPNGETFINNTAGNPGMACGGSGDVLAGVIASLVAQGGDSLKCAAAGVYIHALAGDLARDTFGERSMLPTDMIEALPKAFIEIEK